MRQRLLQFKELNRKTLARTTLGERKGWGKNSAFNTS